MLMFQHTGKKEKKPPHQICCVFPLELFASISSPVPLSISFILLLRNSLTLECIPMPLTSLSPCTRATVWAYAVPMGGRGKVEQNVRMRYSQ